MANAKEIPVYLFTGFLESGKTLFIQDTLEDKRFNAGERTLLIQCEEGEVEFDFSTFSGKYVPPLITVRLVGKSIPGTAVYTGVE